MATVRMSRVRFCFAACFLSSGKVTLECTEPPSQCLFARGTETIPFVGSNDLHAVRFAFGNRIEFNRADDI